MTTLESIIKVEATIQDLQLFKFISDGFKLFYRHYLRVTYCNSQLNFEEYRVLQDDFEGFYLNISGNDMTYRLSELLSLKRSIDMIYNNLLELRPYHADMFKTFLSETSLQLRSTIEENTRPLSVKL